MEETIFYLLRHGETDWNRQHRFQGRENVPLNAAGLEQARRTGQALAGLGIRTVVTSPLDRAWQTGQALAECCGADTVVKDMDLIERDMGVLSGQAAGSQEAYFFPLPDDSMEPLENVGRRMQRALLRWKDAPGPVALVSHGMAINSLLYAVSGGKVGVGRTLLKNCCVNVLRLGPEGLELLAANLAPEEVPGLMAP